MKVQRLPIVLALVNLALLIFTVAQTRSAAAESVPQVVRARALEIVDERGRVRASLNVLPAKTEPNGEAYAETVLLRLITERGRPSVKSARRNRLRESASPALRTRNRHG